MVGCSMASCRGRGSTVAHAQWTSDTAGGNRSVSGAGAGQNKAPGMFLPRPRDLGLTMTKRNFILGNVLAIGRQRKTIAIALTKACRSWVACQSAQPATTRPSYGSSFYSPSRHPAVIEVHRQHGLVQSEIVNGCAEGDNVGANSRRQHTMMVAFCRLLKLPVSLLGSRFVLNARLRIILARQNWMNVV